MINHTKEERLLYYSIGIVALIVAFSVIFMKRILPYFFIYYAILVLAITVLGAILCGVFFIKGRLLSLQNKAMVIKISFAYVINYSVAIILLHHKSVTMNQLAHIFIAYGQLYLAVVFLLMLSNHMEDRTLASIQDKHKYILTGFFLVELATVLLYRSHLIGGVGTEAIINICVTVILTRILMDQLSQQEDLLALFPVGVLVIAQSYLVIIPKENKLNYIIVSWMTLLGLGLILRSEIKTINSLYKNHNHSLYRQFNIYSQNLQKLIDKKTLQIKDANQEIINELEYAKVIQQSLLPPRVYSYRDTVFVSAYYPCERLSGDFYDIFRIDDEYIALYYMDVAGHGVSAALLTMLSNNFLRATDHHFKRLWVQRPDKNLKLLYDHFNTLGLPDEMHLVIFYATYNLATHVLTYCSGGMNCSPIVFRQDGTYELLEQSDGFPICKMAGVFTPVFNASSVVLKTGDRVVFYTDGLTDVVKNKIFDEDDLITFCRKYRKKNIREFNILLEEQISPFKDNLNDDLTYIVMDI